MAEYIYMVRPTRPGFVTDPTPEEMDTVSRHFLYLKSLVDEKKALVAGPCLDAAFGICIYEAETDEEARHIMESDPAVIEGVFSAEMHEFRVSLLQREYVPLRERREEVAVG
jgi:uncharacterized protein YciI